MSGHRRNTTRPSPAPGPRSSLITSAPTRPSPTSRPSPNVTRHCSTSGSLTGTTRRPPSPRRRPGQDGSCPMSPPSPGPTTQARPRTQADAGVWPANGGMGWPGGRRGEIGRDAVTYGADDGGPMQPGGQQATLGADGTLELDDLRRRYGDVIALDGLTFAVPPGEVFGFLGPNGAGKTTAMRAIVGVASLDSGTVRWNGEPIGEEARRRIGYMPEERGLYPGMRVYEQLEYLARLHGLTADEAGKAARYWSERLGLGGRGQDKVEALSLGNQQRVQLAAALVHGPDLLVLDEPFSGLDPVGVDAMSEVLAERAAAGVTMLFSSHQLDLVEHLCTSVAIINHGTLVASGTVEQLAHGGQLRVSVKVA